MIRRADQSDCQRAEALLDAMADGAELAAEDASFLENHQAGCQECRGLGSALELLHDDGAGGPLPPLTTAERDRAVAEIVDAFEAERVSPIDRHRRWPVLVGSIAAGLVVALLVGLIAGKVGPFRKDTPSRCPGSVVMASGEVERNHGSTAAGDAFVAGDEIQTKNGEAAVTLLPEVGAHLSSGTRVRWLEPPQGGIELHLARGNVTIAIGAPLPDPGLAVVTDNARVIAMGTVFSVSSEEKQVEVQTLRGTVELREATGARRRIGPQKKTRLGQGTLTPLSADEQERLRSRVKTFISVQSTSAVIMRVNSSPSGATVRLDGRRVGETPLTASLNMGRHALQVELDGYLPVNEAILVESNLSRDVVLEPTPEPEPEPDPPTHERTKTRRPRDTRLSAEKMLTAAQKLRAAGKWQQAADALLDLTHEYPKSAQARSAWVVLGTIQLDQLGDSATALASFEHYLQENARGSLAQEAAHGRIRALRKLGRREQEIQALEAFIDAYPLALQTPKARQRLRTLRDDD